ncbi:uncharacterized protein NESG_00004 [Nematocida ausubeli]|uniref:Uncharacterized protein n=1 Tax=Nematocida ausubeli (strain ATCC PRA-371 / ERTm2) TaxID=1913371 RepID=A0A086J467_NEMA1|nr:uncharacterized protein NESG_00004 [Nematocida ausubeli]KFG26935.1 hypothetical protein NESG_00004 [Nematocida ausubeli]
MQLVSSRLNVAVRNKHEFLLSVSFHTLINTGSTSVPILHMTDIRPSSLLTHLSVYYYYFQYNYYHKDNLYSCSSFDTWHSVHLFSNILLLLALFGLLAMHLVYK